MTTLTINVLDEWVAVDGYGIAPIDCSSLASNIHAIQFDGTNGEVEYNDGTTNLAITAISDYSAITDLWTSAKSAEDTATADALTAFNILKETYGYKRVTDETNSYATFEDQLDQQYKDALNGTTTWKDAITAVKAAHPKP